MTLLLDTNILVDLEHKIPEVCRKINEISKQDPMPPAITFMNHLEFLWGLRNKKEKHRMAQLAFINEFVILQTSRLTPLIVCNLRNKYEIQGSVIALADLIVASLAIEYNMTLLTKDRDFEKIEELKKIIL